MSISDIIIIVIEVGLLAAIFGAIYGLVRLCLKTFIPTQFHRENGRVPHYLRQFGLFLLLLFALACLGLVATNGYIAYNEGSLLTAQLSLLSSIPRSFWEIRAITLAQCLMLALLVKIVLRTFVHGAIRNLGTFFKNVDSLQANDESINRLFQLLDRVISTGLWLGTVIACLWLLKFPDKTVSFGIWFFGIYCVIAIGLLLVQGLPTVIDTLDALSVRVSAADSPLRFYQRFRYLIPALKQCLELTIYVGVASVVFHYSTPLAWISPHVNKIMGLIAVYFCVRLATEVVNVTVDEFVQRHQSLTAAQQQRRLTITPLLKDCLKYLVYFGAIVAVLSILKIDPTPILAGAGIVGLAVGFGAQNFVEDIVSGFLILFENYYLVGDYIAAGRLEERPVEGVVEAIELRTTKLRHPDGQVQIVRNGEIGSVVNYSKQYIYATVDIPFADETNLELVYPIIDEVGQRLKQDNAEMVIEATQVEGLENLGKSLILVRTTTKVKPGKHLHIQRVLRKLLKDAFDQANIELTDYEPKPTSDVRAQV